MFFHCTRQAESTKVNVLEPSARIARSVETEECASELSKDQCLLFSSSSLLFLENIVYSY